MAKLPPGFRFHPTDVELIMYYLKRKIMGKKLLFEAISELNIYKFSPWDLPDKCCYKSRDLEWYFFCPRERKYASGGRMNRATEAGYWKTTGKDRTVIYNEKIVGSVKTLVFHQGQAPRGQRTDWVIHEYTFEDKEVTDAGLALDSYALCKVFQKSGPGPKNGAQYGAPFKEEDWEVDEEVSPEPMSTDVFSALPVLPHNQGYSVVASIVAPGSTSGWPSSETCQPDVSSTQPSMDRMPLDEPDDAEVPRESNPSDLSLILPVLPDNQSCSIVSSMVDPGYPSTEPVSSCAQICTNEVLLDEKDDEFICLFANFTEDTTLLLADNEKNQNFNQDTDAKTTTYSDGNDIYHNLGDLKNWAQLGDYSLNRMILPEDVSYLELNDLETPLNHSAESIETGQSVLGNFYTSYNHNPDVYPLCSGSLSSCTNLDVRERQLPMLPESYVELLNHSDTANNFRYDSYQGFGAANGFNFCSYEQPENSGRTAQNLETGSHFSGSISAPEQLSASVSLCGGFSMLVKAEVTLGVGGCTNDALSAMLGDRCCVFTFKSYIDETDLIKEVYAYCYELSLVSMCL